MAELLMECEEEELAPWQQMDKDIDDDENDDDEDDDEPIFVREISGSKATSTTNSSRAQSNTFGRAENGTPAIDSNTTFQSANSHYKPQSMSSNVANVTQPVAPMYQPVTRPPISSAIVQPLQRPVGVQEPVRRPVTEGISVQQPQRPSPVMQPISRPVAFTPNSAPVSRNITFPTASQSPLRPVATIPAQPVILNQGYVMTSPQVSSNNSQNVMYALKPSTTLTQYQGVQTLTATGNTTPLIRPLQPLHQIRPVSTPARTTPTFIHRSPPPTQSMPQKSLNLTSVLQQPLHQNPQKTQQTILTQSSSANIGRNENIPVEKRMATIDLTDDSPKKQKTNENVADSRPAVASPVSCPLTPGRQHQTTPLHTTPTKVKASPGSGATPIKNGTPFPRACPKCNIHFNLLEPMKKHMTYCCPEKMQHFFHGVSNAEPSKSQIATEDNDKGKLIMLVSDFYYGKFSGDPQLVQQEQKTNTTFKCFSCQKLLKNNIRFMNHMKHHLELEKQSTESWENHTTCHHCYRHFPTPFQLQCHIESSHTLYESTTICKICELSFESEQILLQHMKDNHKPGEMPYVCQVCNYRSSVFTDVDNHFRNVHENTKSLLCPFCLKVIKSGTPYMQHYMKHQNKGVYRCAKCRLQFLTCKEKMDHKTQHHRTFKKPKQLEGLPPGTKVTIRASTGSITNPSSSPNSSISRNPPATPPKPPPQFLPSTPPQPLPKVLSPKSNKFSPKVNALTPKPKSPPKNTTKRIKTVNTALQSIWYIPGFHKCIECQRQVVDFEGHFHTYVHCSKCKFSTSCNKAYTSHMLSFHGRNASKRFGASKKHPKDKRRITVVCLNCDFLTDVAGLDEMAKHLSESPSHSCQVVTEHVPIFSSTHEGDMSNIENKLTPEKAESDTDACENTKTSPDQEISLLLNREMTNLEQIDATTESPGSGSPIPEDLAQLMEAESKADADLNEKRESSKDNVSEEGESSDNNAVVEEEYKELFSSVKSDHQDENPPNDNIGIEQFLRKDVVDSASSDISEPSSLHLDPLTPSEELEHETTEILQKGAVTAGSNEEEDEDGLPNVSSTCEDEEEQEVVPQDLEHPC
ncbi:zinc finger protein 280D [Gastrophryne carolinensis]